MARGGAREGAGRKPGQLTLRTKKIAEEAAEKGLTPLEVMLDNMRFAHSGAENALQILIREHERAPLEKFDTYRQMLNLRALAQEAAKEAAPYMHPRLASIEHKGPDDGPIQFGPVEIRIVRAPSRGS